ncbi:Hint domain-containing protein [Asaia sp. HN010]|uniref:Hint domain-containing protein n=1 Tax=Asaia sp. HN010 TaxID=3081233 RepID=UPI003018E7BB
MSNAQITNQVYVTSGNTISDSDILRNGGQVYISSGGSGFRVSAFGNGFPSIYEGSIIVGGGGVVKDSFISGGYMSVAGNGATASNITITGRGWQDVGYNNNGAIGIGSAINTHLADGSHQFVYAQGIASNTFVSSGAFQILLQPGAKAYDTEIFANGLMVVSNGASAFNPNVHSGGTGYVSSGGTVFASSGSANGVTIDNGIGVALDAGILSNVTVSNGGRVIISGGGRITGSVMGANGWTTVSSGGQADNIQVSNLGKLIMSGGTAHNVSVQGAGFILPTNSDAGRLEVGSGAYVSGAQINGGYVAVRGEATDVTLTNGGWMDIGLNSFNNAVPAGADTARATHIGNRSQQFVYGTGTARETYISSGGAQDLVASGAKAYDSTVLSGGAVLLKNGTVLSGGNIAAGGLLSAASGGSYGGKITVAGVASGGTILNAGLFEITSGGTFSGPARVNSGGSLLIDSGGRLLGAASLDAGALATVDLQAGGTVVLPGGADYTQLTLTGTGNSNITINGFKGSDPNSSDKILLRDIPRANIIGVGYPNDDTVRLFMRDGTSLDMLIPGVKRLGYDLSDSKDGSTVFAVCFLEGTMIETPFGEVTVETLKAGDFITNFCGNKGEVQKVIWTGKRSVSAGETKDAELTAFPVRIRAGAFGPSVPTDDLLVTPEHCIFVDGVLIPARMLVNGSSIYHDDTLTEYTYYHFETEKHSLVMSNGMLTESYFDTGNRNFLAWENSAPFDFKTINDTNERAAPLVVTQDFVEPIWKDLAKRAGVAHGGSTAPTIVPDLHLLTEQGKVIRKTRVSGNRWIFQLPSSAGLIYLCSQSGRPSEIIGPYVNDRRKLGVLIGEITIFDSNEARKMDVTTFMDQAEGWSNVENFNARWTTGRAVLPIDYGRNPDMLIILSVEVMAFGPHRTVNENTGSGMMEKAFLCNLMEEKRIHF